MKTFTYQSDNEYPQHVRSHRKTVIGIMNDMDTGQSNGKLHRVGMAYLVAEWIVVQEKQVQRLTIYLEKGKSFINATMVDGVFTAVTVIAPQGGTKAQTPAEIAALPVFAELCELWQVARAKRLIS